MEEDFFHRLQTSLNIEGPQNGEWTEVGAHCKLGGSDSLKMVFALTFLFFVSLKKLLGQATASQLCKWIFCILLQFVLDCLPSRFIHIHICTIYHHLYRYEVWLIIAAICILSDCEIEAWKKLGLYDIRTYSALPTDFIKPSGSWSLLSL